MGTGTFEKKIYANIVQGKIVIRGEQGDPGVRERVIIMSDGTTKTVHEYVYDYLEGRIDAVFFEEHASFGTQLKVHLSDYNISGGIDNYVLGVGMKTGYANAIICRLASLDLSKSPTVRIVPRGYTNKNGDKVSTCNIQYAYGVDSMAEAINNFVEYVDGKATYKNGYPPFDYNQAHTADETEEYRLKARKFIREWVAKKMIPQLEARTKVQAPVSPSISPASKPQEEEVHSNGDEPDDLPF